MAQVYTEPGGNATKNMTEPLYQWDQNQRLVIRDADSAPLIHFAYERDDTAYVVQSVLDDDGMTAIIPNDLLKRTGTILAYVNDGNTTVKVVRIPVLPRQKPTNFVDDKTQISTWDILIRAKNEAETAKVIATEQADLSKISASKAELCEINSRESAAAAQEKAIVATDQATIVLEKAAIIEGLISSAEALESSAKISANKAKTSEDNAKQSETISVTNASKATSAATSAEGSAAVAEEIALGMAESKKTIEQNQADITSIKKYINDTGLSAVDGKVCITYESEA